MITPTDFEVDDALSVARLLESATPDFYRGIEPADARLAVVASLIGVGGTDLEPTRVIRLDGRVAGMWCGLFPTSELAGRQLKLLALLSKRLERPTWKAFQEHTAASSKRLPPLPGGLYLSRIAVEESARGRGLGRILIDDFLAAGRGAPVSLHVRADNDGAIRAYERAGFIRQPGNETFIVLTTKPELLLRAQ